MTSSHKKTHMKTRLLNGISLRFRARSLVLVASVALASTQSLASGALPGAGVFVGEVTMKLGKAWIVRPAGRELIRKGTPVRVGDTIHTTSAAHVHIRFVDQALVSVRPDSRLQIVRYQYDAARPQDSVVRLDLEEGITRAISGAAAHEARDNFRMNTPLAAIGVRGTDFVVSASADTVRALVNEGTIIVAPYSMQCTADTFGPCQANSLELSGSADQIVEVRTNALAPVFLPAAGSPPLPEAPAAAPQQRIAAAAPNKENEETAADPYVNSVTSRAVNEKLTVAAAVTPEPGPGTVTGTGNTTTPPVTTPPVVVPVPVPVPVPEVEPPVVVVVPEFTPPAPVSVPTLKTSQLLWGRWAEGNLANERITVTYEEATADNRQITNGGSNYGLFRIENGSKAVKFGLGVVAFSLSQAQATFRQGGSTSLMSVENGQLSLDFAQSRFSTRLDLSHAATGAITFADSGYLDATSGYFYSRNPTQNMAGSASTDGTEAGYFFEKTLENGYVEGLTLWGRQPQ
jgi:hypothetical protein